jgi:hypothetical protein
MHVKVLEFYKVCGTFVLLSHLIQGIEIYVGVCISTDYVLVSWTILKRVCLSYSLLSCIDCLCI